jgi:catechol-2,3-dioxygenase
MHIDALELQAPDLAALARFYGETLDLPIAAHGTDRLVVQAGYTQLAFAAAPPGWHGAYHFAFNIPQNQLAPAKVWLQARVPLARDAGGQDEFDFTHWDARAVYFYDPAGNIVELIARQALDNAAAGAFDARGVLGVSEIGLPSPAVLDTVRRFEARLGLQVFRGSASESFAAVGGETGLFIVVRAGRLWFPDLRVPAEPLPFVVTAATGAGRRFEVSGPDLDIVDLAGEPGS